MHCPRPEDRLLWGWRGSLGLRGRGATDPGGHWPSGRRASPVGRRRLEDEQELLGKAGVNGTTGPAHGRSAPRPRGSMAWVSSSTEGGRPDAAAPEGHHDDQPAGAGHRGRPAAAKSRVAQPPSPADVKGVGTPANQERPAGRRRLWSCWLPLGTHSRRETQQPIPAEVGAEVDEGESGGRLWAGRPLQPVCGHAMPTPTLLAPNSPWLSLLRALAGRALECLILSSCCLLWEVLPDDLRPSRAIPLPALGPTSL